MRDDCLEREFEISRSIKKEVRIINPTPWIDDDCERTLLILRRRERKVRSINPTPWVDDKF